MTDSERDRMLMEIHADMQVVKTKLETDYRALYGNGSPGLVARVTDIEKKIASMTSSTSSILRLLAWLATIIVAIYAAFFKRG